jgi:membrane-bound lytic murein transglycosylase D
MVRLGRITLACALGMALALPAAGSKAAIESQESVTTPNGDATSAPNTAASARTSYQAAWALRQSGEYASAVSTVDAALDSIALALSRDPDAATRRELVDVKSRLSGLRDAARHDLECGTPEPGNEADSRVLNAPAVDGIEPQFNEDVYRWIEFFTGAGRSNFERWLKRSGRYMSLFRSVLHREGLPPDLVHLVFVESGFNVNARSVSAAVGPWQFLRSTGRLFGLTVNQWVDERRDPEKSTVAAARYLKHLYAIFGDWPLALASYNAGEGAILRAIKQQSTTNYWDLRLPRQTEEYVPQFMAVLAISRDPSRYGFDDVELDEPIEFDEIAFKGPVDLRAIAKLADCSYDELRLLNPAARGHALSGPGGVTTLRVPDGKGPALMERLAQGDKLPAVDLTLKHRVRRGETLQGIANRYHVGAQRLASANGIGRKRPLQRGMVLSVPASLRPATPEIIESSDPRASTDYVPARQFKPLARLDGKSDAEGRITVRLKRGETLSQLADRYDVSVEDIRRWNHLHSTSRLRRGTRLKIRTGTAALAEVSKADSVQIASLPAMRSRSHRGRYHAPVHDSSPGRGIVVVHSGETLDGIAKRNGTTVGALKRANGLGSSRIRAGWKLKIPEG